MKRNSTLVLLALAGTFGCADLERTSSTQIEENEADPAAQQNAPVVPGTIWSSPPDPNQAHFANVFLTGNGCPAGSFDVYYYSQYQTFSLSFTQYEVAVDKTKFIGTLDCTVHAEIAAPKGIEVAVASFWYAGSTTLEQGVKASLNISYSFAGLTAATVRNVVPLRELTGPIINQDISRIDEVQGSELVFSGCDAQRVLNVNTRITVVNSTPRKTGSIRLSTVEGKVGQVPADAPRTEFLIKLAQRTCPDKAK